MTHLVPFISCGDLNYHSHGEYYAPEYNAELAADPVCDGRADQGSDKSANGELWMSVFVRCIWEENGRANTKATTNPDLTFEKYGVPSA